MALVVPSQSHPLTQPASTGRVDRVWLQFFLQLAAAVSAGGAPADADYIVGAPDGDLPNARVLTDSPSIDFDLGTPGLAKAHVIVDAAGALDGGTLADLKVRVDGVTVTINGSNQLQATSGGWVPLSLGVEPLQFVSDGAGQPVLVAYP